MTEIIRPAQPGDEKELTAMIHELAEFEQASDECTVTEKQLGEALFSEPPTVFGHIAEVDGQAAAGALWFRNFSTWDGVAGIYLEDLFVRPALRSHGIGRGLLRTLARIARDRGCGRMEWAVLDWNEPALKFYKTLDARPMKEWIVHRLTPVEIGKLAAET